MGAGSWLGFDTSGLLMRRWGGWGGLSDTSPGYGVEVGNRFGLRVSDVCSWGVDEASSTRVCKIGKGGRGRSRGPGSILRVVRGPRLLGDAAWKKGAW